MSKEQPEFFQNVMGKFTPYDGGLKNALARHSDPQTSHEAARSVGKTAVTLMEERVLRAIVEYQGLTTHEIAERAVLPLVSVSPRIRPLVRKGLIEDSGERRMGASGRASIVWRVKL